MTAAEREWEPGDPIYAQHDNGGAGYRTHLYNFRDDASSDVCNCTDAASWPTAKSHHDLRGDTDELEALITWHRRQRHLEETAR